MMGRELISAAARGQGSARRRANLARLGDELGRFDGRVVFVTGAAGQIGTACARGFADEGASVGALDLEPLEGVVSVTADLSQPDQLEAAFSALEGRLGPVDILVQSAAVIARTPFLDITAANIDHVLGVNVRAILLGGRYAAASLIRRGARDGAIVNLTSVSGIVSDAESVAYEASKGAVTMATKGMAVALAEHGIRVNAVGPGSMAKFQEMEAREAFDLDDYERQRIPLGRLGIAADIAAAVMFLASREADYVTGTTLYVDGGALAAW
jgi:NAD(P)-dependent dehydrogenase (short-subunit alcohol dehydrogenase family)